MQNILIWTYHRILPQHSKGAVGVDSFRRQLAIMKRFRSFFIDTSDLANIISGAMTVPHDRVPVMLTFDDAWADNLLWASPILAEAGAKAVLAVNTSLVNPQTGVRTLADGSYEILPASLALENATYRNSFQSFLTWNELAAMRDSGLWDIQAHAHSHLRCIQDFSNVKGFYPENSHWTMEYAFGQPLFDGAPRTSFVSILAAPRTSPLPEFVESLKLADSNTKRLHICQHARKPLRQLESTAEFNARIRQDLDSCRSLLQRKLGITPDSLFWPWGHYSDASIAAARDSGFRLLFTMDKNSFDPARHNPFAIPRIAAPDSPERFLRQFKTFSSPLRLLMRSLFSRLIKH